MRIPCSLPSSPFALCTSYSFPFFTLRLWRINFFSKSGVLISKLLYTTFNQISHLGESLSMGQVNFSCCVAVLGTTTLGIAVLPIAIGTRARIVTTMLVFAWWRWLWREYSPKSELISGNLSSVHQGVQT